LSVYPILFEDASLAQFRPLAWSTPVYEIRCGILNARERTDLARSGATVPEGQGKGGLLCRSGLEPLHGARGWTVGAEAVARELATVQEPVVWLSGRLPANPDLHAALLNAAGAPDPEFIWRDSHGLLALCLAPDRARVLLEHWAAWMQTATESGCWQSSDAGVPDWAPPGVDHLEAPSLDPALLAQGGLGFIWDIVPATAEAIEGDLARLAVEDRWCREPFGLAPAQNGDTPVWGHGLTLRPAGERLPAVGLLSCHMTDPNQVWLAEGVEIAPGTAFDTTAGPIILDHGTRVGSHVALEGPLYVGPGSRIKSGACIYGESSFGIGNRLAGEIGESTFGDFTNKQHEGFIGHAVLGAWINLGALTTCSDLKNNYGPVRVDLGQGPVDSGLRFVGLLMGDHAKTAIGSLFNTGTCVGFASNIFDGGMPPKYVGNFQWGGQAGCPVYAVEKAVETAAVVMSRRGCQFTPAHADLFQSLTRG